jgi:hypothetical protein
MNLVTYGLYSINACHVTSVYESFPIIDGMEGYGAVVRYIGGYNDVHLGPVFAYKRLFKSHNNIIRWVR